MSEKNLKIFNKLSYDFVSNMRIACVYGLSKRSGFFVDNNDDVYMIRFFDSKTKITPKKIEGLSKMGICDFAYGDGHCVAMNRNGEIFLWGDNGRKQIDGSDEKVVNAPKQIANFNGKVIQIACGDTHTMVLTENGEIFSWGDNENDQIGNGTDDIAIPSPTNIKILTDNNAKIKSIVCGSVNSFALLDDGTVYGWGCNEYGELGLGAHHIQTLPCRVSALNDIKKVVCGYRHTLALTNDGTVHAMGENAYGQLGDGNTVNQNIPIKLNMEFADIAAHRCNDISVGMGINGKYFVWGCVSGEIITKPIEVNCQTFNDAFLLYAENKMMYKPIVITDEADDENGIGSLLFNELFSDCVVIVDGHEMPAHKNILWSQSSYFRMMFEANMKENRENRIEISDFDVNVIKEILRFIYTGECFNLGNFTIVSNLLIAAEKYDLQQLKKICSDAIGTQISNESVFKVMSFAETHNDIGLKRKCVEFIGENKNEIIKKLRRN